MAPPIENNTVPPAITGSENENENNGQNSDNVNNESNIDQPPHEYLTPAQKAQLTKLKNAERLSALEENVAKIASQIDRFINHPPSANPQQPSASTHNNILVHNRPSLSTSQPQTTSVSGGPPAPPAHVNSYKSRTSTPSKRARHGSRTSRASNRANVTRYNDFPNTDSFEDDFVLDPRTEKQARLEASSLMESLNPTFPKSDGKTLFDHMSRKQLPVTMPRHLLDLRAQRRVKSLESQDDLSFPDFIQGFSKLILTHPIQNRTVKAMITHLAQVGEDVATYDWPQIREWSNTILYDIAAQRYTWRDTRVIEAERNRAAIHAGATKASQSDFNVCPLYNRGKCLHDSSHGHMHIHACAFCWLSWGVENAHPISICKKRTASQSSYQSRQPSSPARNRNQHRRGNQPNYNHNHRDHDSKND